ncbi:MAG: hypothetical protein MHM6MM_004170 [Cercozoa sp. M6MM]
MQNYLSEDTPLMVAKSLFAKYDKDGTGTLTTDELVDLFGDFGVQDEQQVRTFQLLMDKNANGLVNCDEFLNFVKTENRLDTLTDASRYGLLQMAVQRFQHYDTTKSGSIDASEFDQVMADVGCVDPARVAHAKQVLDKDGDGVISFPEFLEWLNWVPLQ